MKIEHEVDDGVVLILITLQTIDPSLLPNYSKARFIRFSSRPFNFFKTFLPSARWPRRVTMAS